MIRPAFRDTLLERSLTMVALVLLGANAPTRARLDAVLVRIARA